ncbi:hypothetical protein J6590_013913 [Homalodisca vitripennis]|nr:hypothetical protein J6590_013913 [Homalodisca vitripennis]
MIAIRHMLIDWTTAHNEIIYSHNAAVEGACPEATKVNGLIRQRCRQLIDPSCQLQQTASRSCGGRTKETYRWINAGQ